MTDDRPQHLDEDDDEQFCYRHPDRETALACGNCERPICVDCAVTAAVGLKCPECARQPRAALAVVPRGKLVRGVVAGVVAGIVGGTLYVQLLGGFFAFIIAFLIGMAIGEIVRRAAGGFRDPLLARVAAICAGLGLAYPVLLDLLAGGSIGRGGAFVLFGAAIAAYAAATRAS